MTKLVKIKDYWFLGRKEWEFFHRYINLNTHDLNQEIIAGKMTRALDHIADDILLMNKRLLYDSFISPLDSHYSYPASDDADRLLGDSVGLALPLDEMLSWSDEHDGEVKISRRTPVQSEPLVEARSTLHSYGRMMKWQLLEGNYTLAAYTAFRDEVIVKVFDEYFKERELLREHWFMEGPF
jgi:hypothetical protein